MDRYRIAVDIGGTFSDFVILDEGHDAFSILKLPSTPQDPSLAIGQGLKELAHRGINPDAITFFSHGTTVATNALLEGKGAKVGLLITQGFRGIYEVRDQTRGYGAATYDLFFARPRPLVPPRLIEEIPERLDYRGEVLRPLDEEAARQAILRLKGKGVQAIAVCLLFSFMNPAHERALERLVQQLYPGCRVSLSGDILPQIREYYRLSTTLVNAYVAPCLGRYLEQMEQHLRHLGVDTPQLYVMQSNGGVTTFAHAAAQAVTTILSGPAAGVIAGATLGHLAGMDDLITLDMGGTSCDLAYVEAGAPVQTKRGQIGGHDLQVPMLDIKTISAGGGTIAWTDRVGLLHIGPHSAGAEPGPVCYGHGGTEPTVTDADLVLGYLNPDYFLGGQICLDRGLAEQAITAKIAKPMGLSLLEAASGIARLVNCQMAESIKRMASERGLDLRDVGLMAFGGAGPVHAGRLAAELGIRRVLVPPTPGTTSAMGLLLADLRRDYMRSCLQPLAQTSPGEVNNLFAGLRHKALTDLREEDFAEAEVQLHRALDMRYAGQGYELTIPVDLGPGEADLPGWREFGPEELAAMRCRFDDTHQRMHGLRAEGEPVEIVNYRLVATVRVPQIHLRQGVPAAGDAEVALKGTRPAYFEELAGMAACPLYDRQLLAPGHSLVGPAIIEQPDSTTVLYPGQRAIVDPFGNLLIHLEAGR